MSHREKAFWALITGLVFVVIALGLIAYAICQSSDETTSAVVPSVFAATAIAVSCSVYSSRESRKASKEAKIRDEGTSPPADCPPEA